MHHYTIEYQKAGDGRIATFHTHASNDGQAIQDLFDNVPDVESGSITFKLPVTRRPV